MVDERGGKKMLLFLNGVRSLTTEAGSSAQGSLVLNFMNSLWISCEIRAEERHHQVCLRLEDLLLDELGKFQEILRYFRP